MVNIECVLWYKLLAFEVIKAIVQKQTVFKQLYEEIPQNSETSSSSNEGYIIVDLVNAICNFVQRMIRESQTSVLSLQQYLRRESRLDTLLERSAPMSSLEECLALALETISVTATSMSILADIHKLDLDEEVSEEEAKKIKHNREVCMNVKLVNLCHPMIIEHFNLTKTINRFVKL